MIQYRRIAAIVLGGWLGAAAFADVAVTQNFQTVDRFLRNPGSNLTARELEKIGTDRERPILRRNAGEENSYLFEQWESVELLVAAVLIGFLFVGGKRSAPMISLAVAMLLVVAAQRFYLSPEITALGRRIADLSVDDPTGPQVNARFWASHGIYSGAEILKLLLGVALAVLLALPRRKDFDPGSRDLEPELMVGIGAKGRVA